MTEPRAATGVETPLPPPEPSAPSVPAWGADPLALQRLAHTAGPRIEAPPLLPADTAPTAAVALAEPSMSAVDDTPAATDLRAHAANAARSIRSKANARRRRRTIALRLVGLGVLAGVALVAFWGWTTYRAEHSEELVVDESLGVPAVQLATGELAAPGDGRVVTLDQLLPDALLANAVRRPDVDGHTIYVVNTQDFAGSDSGEYLRWIGTLERLPAIDSDHSAFDVVPPLFRGQVAIAVLADDGQASRVVVRGRDPLLSVVLVG